MYNNVNELYDSTLVVILVPLNYKRISVKYNEQLEIK